MIAITLAINWSTNRNNVTHVPKDYQDTLLYNMVSQQLFIESQF